MARSAQRKHIHTAFVAETEKDPMSPHEPKKNAERARNRDSRLLGGFRAMPGSTTAAVAFVVVIFLGGGGVAAAKWNQSATATIDIAAGEAPTTEPPVGAQSIVLWPVP